MGMDSRRLAARARQPGHDRTFRDSETRFISALERVLGTDDWVIIDHPRHLARFIEGRYGVIPEASIEHRQTGRVMYFEVKKQGPAGNADERACKHHTVQFYKEIHQLTGLDYHPFVTILCENLAIDERYTLKHPYYFEEDHYFLWENYDLDLLADFLAKIATRWLIHSNTIEPDTIPE